MAVGRFFTEALAEGAFLGLLKRAWNWGKKTFTTLGLAQPLSEAVKKGLVDDKGWEDENLLARAFAECGLFDDQKKMILGALLRMEEMDKKNNTHYARSFRILATVNDNNPDNGVRPSVHILEEIGSLCNTEEEVLSYIMALGGMVDSSTSWEYFKKISKETAFPYFLENFSLLRQKLGILSNEMRELTEKREKAFNKLPWWRKLLGLYRI